MMCVSQVDVPAGLVDLGIGQPDFDLLPVELLARAAAQRLGSGEHRFLNYGAEQGDGTFRRALAHFLQEHYGQPVPPEQLLTTAGTSQALDLVCTVFARPGDTVFVEDPTYFLALRIFADRELKVVPVPTDAQGLQVRALAGMMAEQRPAFLYTIPTFHNPTGATLPAGRRRRLLELSRKHKLLLVTDDVYQLLHYAKEPPPPLVALPDSENTLSLGTFSKILAPGLRLGWIQTAPLLLARILESGLLASGGGFNPFTSALVQVVLAEGWQAAHLAHLRATYRRRLAAMAEALAAELGERVRYRVPKGGFFVWVTLPDGIAATSLRERARHHGVDFRPGVLFSGREGCRHQLRLCFAFYDEAQIREGIRRLGAALREANGDNGL